jgi:hypothetical protein
MPTFDLKKITAVKGKQEFYQLTENDSPDLSGVEKAKDKDAEINERKRGVLDEFENGLETKYQKDKEKILTYMNQVANNQLLPKTKFRHLNKGAKKGEIKEYEFKSGDLRYYCIGLPNGKVVVICGYKNGQDGDIARLGKIKKDVYQQVIKKLPK